MRSDKMQELLQELLRNDLPNRIDTSLLEERDYERPIIEIEKLDPITIELTPSDSDDLRENKIVDLIFDISGTYSKKSSMESKHAIGNQQFWDDGCTLKIKLSEGKLLIESFDSCIKDTTF